MDDFVSTVPMLESAITTLVWRWGVSPHRSLTALTEVADELGVDLADLAVLVLASELQRQARMQPTSSEPPSGSRSRNVEVDEPGAGWLIRNPGDPGDVRSRRLSPVDVAPDPHGPGVEAGLSRRESEIIALLTLGLSNQDIAQRCHLSINSVKTYIRTAYRKMGVNSRTRALLWAFDHGFRQPPSEHPAPRDAGDEPTASLERPLRALPSLRRMG